MKRIIISIIALAVACMVAGAQELSFDRGSSRISLGAGLPNLSSGTVKLPPLQASFEYGVAAFGQSSIGVGGAFEYAATSGTRTVCGEVFCKYHYNFTDRFDLDAHAGVGYGSYGTLKTANYSIGADANYKFSEGFGVFGGLESSSLPGRAFLRAGIFFQL